MLVDDMQNIENIYTEAIKSGVSLGMLIEVNGGHNRCGIGVASAPGGCDLLLAMAREIISRSPALRFRGIHCYNGALQHVRGAIDRRDRVFSGPVAAARTAVDALSAAGIACPVITGGGTGSFRSEVEGGVHNEIQPGSYCFMDVDYGLNDEKYSIFENALFIHTRVISKAVDTNHRAVVDAGMKAISFDSGPPVAINGFLDGNDVVDGITVLNGGDEHSILMGAAVHQWNVGDTLRLIPGHIDPTVNMHNFIVVMDNGPLQLDGSPSGEPVVVDLWDVSGRGPGL